jgi:DNA replication initiation complex subunit (GINS family)
MTADLKKIFDEYLDSNPEILQSLNAAPTAYEEEKAEQEKRASQLSGYQLLADSKQYGGNEDGQVNGQEDLAAKEIQKKDQEQMALAISLVIGAGVTLASEASGNNSNLSPIPTENFIG